MPGPQWLAMQREAQLAAEQIAQGVTALGRANHAQTGLYSQAFFGLSIGLERVGKLVFIANHVIEHDGEFPTDGDLRQIGHDLGPLLSRCEIIGNGLDPDRSYSERPSDPIHEGIIEVLSLFATKLRYYNLNHLAGIAENQQDPIALWWERVAAPICDRHYSQRQRERDEATAENMERLIGGTSFVIHRTEDGTDIEDIRTLCRRGMATTVVQKYGRLYVLQIVRWLTSMIFELAHRGAYELRFGSLLGLNEPFVLFYNNDKMLRDKKNWSIYRL